MRSTNRITEPFPQFEFKNYIPLQLNSTPFSCFEKMYVYYIEPFITEFGHAVDHVVFISAYQAICQQKNKRKPRETFCYSSEHSDYEALLDFLTIHYGILLIQKTPNEV